MDIHGSQKDDSSVLVRFGGTVVRHEDENGNFWFLQEVAAAVGMVPYDVPIAGYGAKTVNKRALVCRASRGRL